MFQLFANGEVTSDIAVSFFYQVLSGLQMHGQHESTRSLLLNLTQQMYELLVRFIESEKMYMEDRKIQHKYLPF